jgi:hypothetical protein
VTDVRRAQGAPWPEKEAGSTRPADCNVWVIETASVGVHRRPPCHLIATRRSAADDAPQSNAEEFDEAMHRDDLIARIDKSGFGTVERLLTSG